MDTLIRQYRIEIYVRNGIEFRKRGPKSFCHIGAPQRRVHVSRVRVGQSGAAWGHEEDRVGPSVSEVQQEVKANEYTI